MKIMKKKTAILFVLLVLAMFLTYVMLKNNDTELSKIDNKVVKTKITDKIEVTENTEIVSESEIEDQTESDEKTGDELPLDYLINEKNNLDKRERSETVLAEKQKDIREPNSKNRQDTAEEQEDTELLHDLENMEDTENKGKIEMSTEKMSEDTDNSWNKIPPVVENHVTGGNMLPFDEF